MNYQYYNPYGYTGNTNPSNIYFANDRLYSGLGMGGMFSNINSTLDIADAYIYNSPFNSSNSGYGSANYGSNYGSGSMNMQIQQGFDYAYQMAAYRDSLRSQGYNNMQIEQMINGNQQQTQSTDGYNDLMSMLLLTSLFNDSDSADDADNTDDTDSNTSWMDSILSLFGAGSGTNSNSSNLLSLLGLGSGTNSNSLNLLSLFGL